MLDTSKITFADLSDDLDDHDIPMLDRKTLPDSSIKSQTQWSWRQDGIVVIKDFIPQPLIDAYCEVRAKLNRPGGWKSPVPYMQVKELRDICLYEPLMDELQHLLGAEMGLHLNLTGWVSTERKWHQDDYLNPPFVKSHYAAVWMALDDIHPDSGPFQFVRGSHRWPLIRREKVFQYLTAQERESQDWPTFTQDWVARACEQEIERRGAKVESFIAKKGDVLIWHGRLVHQGSKPNVPGMQRKALIAHYSALTHRPDMPERAVHSNGRTYFVHHQPLE